MREPLNCIILKQDSSVVLEYVCRICNRGISTGWIAFWWYVTLVPLILKLKKVGHASQMWWIFLSNSGIYWRALSSQHFVLKIQHSQKYQLIQRITCTLCLKVTSHTWHSSLPAYNSESLQTPVLRMAYLPDPYHVPCQTFICLKKRNLNWK